jgi:hypothetical protein
MPSATYSKFRPRSDSLKSLQLIQMNILPRTIAYRLEMRRHNLSVQPPGKPNEHAPRRPCAGPWQFPRGLFHAHAATRSQAAGPTVELVGSLHSEARRANMVRYTFGASQNRQCIAAPRAAHHALPHPSVVRPRCRAALCR